MVAETRAAFPRDGWQLEFEGLVVDNLDVDILGDTRFMEKNDLTICPAKRQLILIDLKVLWLTTWMSIYWEIHASWRRTI